MLNELVYVIGAFIVCWLNFVIIDIFLGLPERPGVRGVRQIAHAIEEYGGHLNGGYMMGNIVCSPDASAGTLLASCCYYAFSSPLGGLIAALAVFFGNRICSDPGYAGTTGALTTTMWIYLLSHFGFQPEHFIAGMVIAIFTIQALHHRLSSKLLAKIAGVLGVIK